MGFLSPMEMNIGWGCEGRIAPRARGTALICDPCGLMPIGGIRLPYE